MTDKPKDIPLTEVDSSAIAAHGYDPETGVMRVKFRSGDIYDHDVSPETYAAFTGSASLGSFFNKKIRPHAQGRKI